MDGQYSEHYEKINGNQQELDYLVINSMRKIARHAVTVYSGSAAIAKLGVPGVGISVRRRSSRRERPISAR